MVRFVKQPGSPGVTANRKDGRPTILLIGATGQVGWELSRSLASLGHVVATSRRTGATSRRLDLLQPESIRTAIRRVRPALIVNSAAYTDVDRAEKESPFAMAINGDAVGVLAEEAKQIGAALVHYSTDYVFDGSGDRPWAEDDHPAPLNTYGRSKLAGEMAIRSAKTPHLILRTSWVYGVHGRNFVKNMLRLGLECSTLRVVGDQVGAPTSARVIADITAQILAQAMGRFADLLGTHGGTYHLCCQGEAGWHEFALEIFRLAESHQFPLVVEQVERIGSNEYPTPARRPKNSRLDCGRLAKTFGLVPSDWRIALEHALDDLLEAPLNDRVAKICRCRASCQSTAEAAP